MRKPNGYGSVVKLSGARRKPFAVRLHTGYKENGTSQYKYIGYYATRKEAEMQLANYNVNPYLLNNVTLLDVWKQYSESEMKKLAITTQRTKVGIFPLFKPIEKCIFSEIKPLQIQSIIDTAKPTVQMLIKSLYMNLESFAIKHEYTNKSFASTLSVAKWEGQKKKEVFSEEEINKLWENTDNPIIRDALLLIYTGLRVSEYLALTPNSIKDGCITGGCKTEAGKNRIIPIHPRITPLIQDKLDSCQNGVLCGHDNAGNFRYAWNKEKLLKGYSFHECRHTFRTRLDNADANEVCIDLLMGHKGKSVGKQFYTHKTIEQLKDTIALLK